MRICATATCITTLVVLVYGFIAADHNACQADPKTRSDDESLHKFLNGEEVNKSLIGPYVLCENIRTGLQNKEGKINKPYLKSSLSGLIDNETELNDIMERCPVEKDDPQDTAIALTKCIYNNGSLLRKLENNTFFNQVISAILRH